jgi:hypothetical protein
MSIFCKYSIGTILFLFVNSLVNIRYSPSKNEVEGEVEITGITLTEFEPLHVPLCVLRVTYVYSKYFL